MSEVPKDRHGHPIPPCDDCGKLPCVCPPDCTGPDCAYGLLAPMTPEKPGGPQGEWAPVDMVLSREIFRVSRMGGIWSEESLAALICEHRTKVAPPSPAADAQKCCAEFGEDMGYGEIHGQACPTRRGPVPRGESEPPREAAYHCALCSPLPGTVELARLDYELSKECASKGHGKLRYFCDECMARRLREVTTLREQLAQAQKRGDAEHEARKANERLVAELTERGNSWQSDFIKAEAQASETAAKLERLRETLAMAHDCATYSAEDDTCDGCFISEALAATKPEEPS